MNVGLVIYGDLSIRTGGFLYDRKLVEFLRTNQHQVEIFSTPWRPYISQMVDNLNPRLSQWLADVQPDVLIQDELVHPSFFLQNYKLRRTFSIPFISLVHHLRSSEPALRVVQRFHAMIERAYLSSVDGFICNSQSTLESVSALLREPPPAIVAYPGTDHIHPRVSASEVQKRAMRTGSLRLLFLGSITPRKGLGTLLDALMQLDRDQWHLDIVGDSSFNPGYASTLQHSSLRGNLSSNITWHGVLPDDELQSIWSNSHALIVPSSYEGFGIVYLEAMANGLVPIGTTAGGAHEIINAGVNGFLVPPGDRSALAAHIQKLCEDRERLTHMAFAGMKRYSVHPTWEASMQEIQSFLVERMERYKQDNTRAIEQAQLMPKE